MISDSFYGKKTFVIHFLEKSFVTYFNLKIIYNELI